MDTQGKKKICQIYMEVPLCMGAAARLARPAGPVG